jgi:hypothetical protein
MTVKPSTNYNVYSHAGKTDGRYTSRKDAVLREVPLTLHCT